jgi:hypothetical protein
MWPCSFQWVIIKLEKKTTDFHAPKKIRIKQIMYGSGRNIATPFKS